VDEKMLSWELKRPLGWYKYFTPDAILDSVREGDRHIAALEDQLQTARELSTERQRALEIERTNVAMLRQENDRLRQENGRLQYIAIDSEILRDVREVLHTPQGKNDVVHAHDVWQESQRLYAADPNAAYFRELLTNIGLAIGMPEGFDFKDLLGKVLRLKHTLDLLLGRNGL